MEKPQPKPVAIPIGMLESMYNIKKTMAYDLIRQNRLVRVRLGRKTLVTVASAEALIAAAADSADAGGL